MRRSVIQLAGRTLVLSLPSAWVKKCGIMKGHELDVEERETCLVISKPENSSIENVKIDISGLNTAVAWYYLTAAYAKGSEEIEIFFSNQFITNPYTNKKIKTIFYISDIIDDLIGMEIISQKTKSCMIREVSVPKIEEYNTILRKLFLILLSMIEDCLESGAKHRQDIILREEKRINKYSNFCLRLLNRLNGSRQDYVVVRNLEEIGDILKDNLTEFRKEDLIQLKDAARLFYKAFFSVKKEDIIKFHSIRHLIKDKKDAILFSDVLDKMMECINSRLTSKL